MVELTTMSRKKVLYLFLFLVMFWFTNTVSTKHFKNIHRDVLTEKEMESRNAIMDVLGVKDTSDGRIKVITVAYDSNIVTYLTRGISTTETLLELGYPLGSKNRILSNSPIDRLYKESYITIQTYVTEVSQVFVTIPFETITEGESLCSSMTEKRIAQKGETGRKVQTIEKYFLDGEYISEKVVNEEILKQPVKEIISLSGGIHPPDSVPQIGFNCPYWKSEVDKINATEEENEWLKFTMEKESGCNAERNKGFHKGLFQWNPCLWYKQYPTDNIFDGHAQIKRTLEKIRGCADPARMWPGVYKQYVNTYKKELSHRYVCGYL